MMVAQTRGGSGPKSQGSTACHWKLLLCNIYQAHYVHFHPAGPPASLELSSVFLWESWKCLESS